MKILIDLPDSTSKKLTEIAKKEKRSRKSYIELVIINHVEDLNRKKGK